MGKGAVGDWDGKKQQRVNLHIYHTNMYGTLPPPPNKEMKKIKITRKKKEERKFCKSRLL